GLDDEIGVHSLDATRVHNSGGTDTDRTVIHPICSGERGWDARAELVSSRGGIGHDALQIGSRFLRQLLQRTATEKMNRVSLDEQRRVGGSVHVTDNGGLQLAGTSVRRGIMTIVTALCLRTRRAYRVHRK